PPNLFTRPCKQLFRFPKDPERKKKWVVNCQRDFEPTPHSRLCQTQIKCFTIHCLLYFVLCV
uniref:THAP-type domain-containing protein n=1 Tax=Oryzias sinensis TaxID=183150 RepID=A0A8C7Y0X2_9TELE